MVVFKNLKNFKIGETVRCYFGKGVCHEGVISFIHPRNGWLLIDVTRIIESDNDRVLERVLQGKNCHIKLSESFWFSEVYRVSEDWKEPQPIKTGLHSGALAFPLKKKRNRTIVKNYDSGCEDFGDPFGIKELLDGKL